MLSEKSKVQKSMSGFSKEGRNVRIYICNLLVDTLNNSGTKYMLRRVVMYEV